jgi:hypothetical protein
MRLSYSPFYTCIYVHVSWLMREVKGIGGPPLSILHTFYRQRVSTMLQHAQAISILRCVVAISEGSSKLSEGSSKLGVIWRGSPLSLFDMHLATKGGLGTWCSLCGSPSSMVLLVRFLGLGSFHFLGCGSFHFVPCILPFFGCFGLFMIGRVSSSQLCSQ